MSASAPIVGFLCRSRFVKGDDLEPFVEYFPNHMLSLLYEPMPKTIAHPFSDLLPFKYAAGDFRDCCSGLLLFVDPTVPQFYVCNPATKQCIGIPKQDASQTACLAFDPLESHHYKIVKFHLRSKLHFDIFSSQTGKWVTHPIPVEPPIHVIFMKRTVYFDGALYCLAYVEDAHHSKYLARFDLHQLKAHLIERPDRDCADYNGFVGVSRGSLYFYNNQNLMLFIWLFDARNRRPGRWVLKHSICLRDLTECPFRERLKPLPSSLRFKPHACDPNSEDLFFVGPRVVLRYDPRNKEIQALTTNSIPLLWKDHLCRSVCFVYIHALLLDPEGFP